MGDGQLSDNEVRMDRTCIASYTAMGNGHAHPAYKLMSANEYYALTELSAQVAKLAREVSNAKNLQIEVTTTVPGMVTFLLWVIAGSLFGIAIGVAGIAEMINV